MKLYCHPASTTSRPVMLFAAENGIALDQQIVDLFTGEHYQPPFEAINPNHLVPVLEDKIGSPLYPSDLKQRARVNERMDWINTQLCRDFAYGFIYPQIFPFHKRRSVEAHEATLQWGKERAQGWMKVLEQHILGPDNAYVCGHDMTIADYFCASFVALAELVGSDLKTYPNVKRWLDRMKGLESWQRINETINGYGASLKGQAMQALA
jgi:glutathione S-transferase